MNRRAWLGALAAFAAACASKKENRFDFGEAKKKYPMRGKVVRLRRETRVATVVHEKIGDWMEPMTMEFPVPNEKEYDLLKRGQTIRATVNVNDTYFWLTDVKVEIGVE